MRSQIDLRLARHGAILLLLGMLSGFVIRGFHNRGAGDAAHLVGFLGGYGLIAIGLLWPRLNLGRSWSIAGAWITVVSLYLNWVGVMLLVVGSGPTAAGMSIPGSPTSWNGAAGVVLKLAIVTSLLSVIIILAGLRNLAESTASPGGARATVTTM
jgi:hydroxylaminobenzene mutase